MSISFPLNPELNDIHTQNGESWKYNGFAWELAPVVLAAVKGEQGIQGEPGMDGNRLFNRRVVPDDINHISADDVGGIVEATSSALKQFTVTSIGLVPGNMITVVNNSSTELKLVGTFRRVGGSPGSYAMAGYTMVTLYWPGSNYWILV